MNRRSLLVTHIIAHICLLQDIPTIDDLNRKTEQELEVLVNEIDSALVGQ